MEKKAGRFTYNFLKTVHILMICLWLGAVSSVVLIFFFLDRDSSPEIINTTNKIMEKIDYFIIVPTSGICWFSGILLSAKSRWGFFIHKWITLKLVIGSLLILFGIFFLAPWVMQSDDLFVSDFEKYMNVQDKLGISMTVQLSIIICLVIISSVKPWGKFPVKTNK